VSSALPEWKWQERCRISDDVDEEQKQALTDDCTLAVGVRKSIGVSVHWARACILCSQRTVLRRDRFSAYRALRSVHSDTVGTVVMRSLEKL
jgi:hypothetical protein